MYNLLFMNQKVILGGKMRILRLFARNINIIKISGGGSHACMCICELCNFTHTFLWSFVLAQKFNFEYCIMNWTGCGWNPHGRNFYYCIHICLGGLKEDNEYLLCYSSFRTFDTQKVYKLVTDIRRSVKCVAGSSCRAV